MRKKNRKDSGAKRPPESSLRQSKTQDFLEKIRSDNSMVEYFTQLRILNPAAQLTANLNEPRREGGFVRLAHARDEFTAPVLTKGKAVLAKAAEERKLGKKTEKTGRKSKAGPGKRLKKPQKRRLTRNKRARK